MITKEQIEKKHRVEISCEEASAYNHGFNTCLDLLWPVVEALKEYKYEGVLVSIPTNYGDDRRHSVEMIAEKALADLTNKISQSQGTGEK